MKERAAVVTGASSGLGRAIALALNREGYRVIAGARSFSSEDQFLGEGISCLTLDVTEEASVQAFFKKALALEKKIDLLVNCAGILCMGACEEIPVEEYERVMDTNFIGMVRTIQAVLPHFRHNRAGRIINLSSINGEMGIPFQSAYTASKHAVEGYSECLQMEVKPFHIEVMVVEPGDHRGGSNAYRGHIKSEQSPYEKSRESAIAAIHRDEANGLLPEALGRKLVRVLRRRRLPFRLIIADPLQRTIAYCHRLLPAKLLLWVLRQYYITKD